MRPVRLQLSRSKGFDLVRVSRKYNRRDVVNVARPGRWGNPFTVTDKYPPGTAFAGGRYFAVPTVEEAVAMFRQMIEENPTQFRDLKELRGKNLACWCRHGQPCHADVLLELANR